MRNYIPQQQQFEHFSDLANATANQYTLSFKDACKALKCSRSWAQKYIRPHKYIFNQFIFDSIVSCQKRSKRVYKTNFIKPEFIETYYQEQLFPYSKLFIKKR